MEYKFFFLFSTFDTFQVGCECAVCDDKNWSIKPSQVKLFSLTFSRERQKLKMSNIETGKPSLLKQAALQIVAGGSAGFVEVCIMHPLDLVKTRLQIQNKKTMGSTGAGTQIYYNGVLDCFRKMYRHEGMFSYWKGILPPILAETPKRATKFVCFEQYKRFFMFGSDKPTPLVSISSLTHSLALAHRVPIVFTFFLNGFFDFY